VRERGQVFGGGRRRSARGGRRRSGSAATSMREDDLSTVRRRGVDSTSGNGTQSSTPEVTRVSSVSRRGGKVQMWRYTDEVYRRVVRGLSERERSTITCFLWVWWETRNKANAGERMLTVEEVQQRTMEASLF
jgi:hypothetical protein